VLSNNSRICFSLGCIADDSISESEFDHRGSDDESDSDEDSDEDDDSDSDSDSSSDLNENSNDSNSISQSMSQNINSQLLNSEGADSNNIFFTLLS
jgi:serine-aspartate repeat-containing protein C/D/E